jgi:hypothetical protein
MIHVSDATLEIAPGEELKEEDIEIFRILDFNLSCKLQ